MSEAFKSPERLVTEQEVISLLDIRGVENPEANAFMGRYIDQCHAEADAEAAATPQNSEVSNRASIKADIKIGLLYSKTVRYKDYAREFLEETRMAASEKDSTQDLVSEIDFLISNLN